MKLMTVFDIGLSSLYICSVIEYLFRHVLHDYGSLWKISKTVCSKIKMVFSGFLLTKYFVLIYIIRFSGVTIKTALQAVLKINKFLSSQR